MGVSQEVRTLKPLGCALQQKTNPLTGSTQASVPDGFAGPLQERFVKENVKVLMLTNNPLARNVIFLKPFLPRRGQ